MNEIVVDPVDPTKDSTPPDVNIQRAIANNTYK